MIAGKNRASANGKHLGEDKDKAIGLALAQIERQFGKGAIMRLGESAAMDVDVISTGAISLDAALGVGGVPKGRVIELFGPEAAGKTMLALHIVSPGAKDRHRGFHRRRTRARREFCPSAGR